MQRQDTISAISIANFSQVVEVWEASVRATHHFLILLQRLLIDKQTGFEHALRMYMTPKTIFKETENQCSK